MQAEQPNEISHEGDSMRIALRGRHNVWDDLGAAWELLKITVLLGLFFWLLLSVLGVAVGFDIDEDARIVLSAVVSGFVFLLSLALLLRLTEWIRSRFGADIIELTPSGWRRTRFSGPLRWKHTFDPSDGWRSLLNEDALRAMRGWRRIVVSDLGTPGERRWIHEEIRGRFPRPAPSRALSPAYTFREVSGGFHVSGPFGRVFAKTFLHVTRNAIEHRLEVLGITHTTRVTDGALFLKSPDLQKVILEACPKGFFGRSAVIAKSRCGIGDTLALGERLAHETGWELEIAPHVWEC